MSFYRSNEERSVPLEDIFSQDTSNFLSIMFIPASIKEIEDFYFNLAMTDEDYAKIWDATLEDLPPMMDHSSDLFNKLVAMKLKGEDSIASPKYTHQVVWNLECSPECMSSECMDEISYHDGQSNTLTSICEIQGWDDLKKRASDCIYND